MKILYCIQNKILEDVLLKNRIINKISEIIRNKNELTHKKVSAFNPDYIMFPHWSYMVPENILNISAYVFTHHPCHLEEGVLQFKI